MTVIVDTFEVTNNPNTEKQLIKAKVDYEVISLTKGGDYLIEGNIAKIVIERKEISDLFHSNHEGRLQKQMQKLMSEYPDYKKILLIEGNISSLVARYMKRSGLSKPVNGVVTFENNTKFKILAKHSAEYVGIVNSIVTGTEINIIQLSSKWQTILLLKNLDEWAQGQRYSKRMNEVKKVGRDITKEVEDMVMAVKGVGWNKTQEILSKSNSIADLVHTFDDPNINVKELFGENLSEHLREVLYHKVEVKNENKGKKKGKSGGKHK